MGIRRIESFGAACDKCHRSCLYDECSTMEAAWKCAHDVGWTGAYGYDLFCPRCSCPHTRNPDGVCTACGDLG